jgi:hypothetical protein
LGRLRESLRRLKREAAAEMVVIPQRDGTVKRFPLSAQAEAFVSMCEGQDHPLLVAARNSSDVWWSEGVYSTDPATMQDVEDLSEP